MNANETMQVLLSDELKGARIVGFSYEPAIFVLRLEAKRHLELDMLAPWRYSDEHGATVPEEEVSQYQQSEVDAEHARRLVKSIGRLIASVSLGGDGTLRIALDDQTEVLVPGTSSVFDRSWMIRLPPDQDDRRSMGCDSEGNVFVNWS